MEWIILVYFTVFQLYVQISIFSRHQMDGMSQYWCVSLYFSYMSKFPYSPGIRWIVFAAVWMFFGLKWVMWFWCRSHDSSCGHVITMVMHPWIQALDTSVKTKSKWLTKSVSVFKFIITIPAGIWYICDSKTVLKLILWIFTHYLKATRLHS